MLSYSFRQRHRNLVSCSGSELQEILKYSALNLSKLNNRISSFRKWINQALSLAGFMVMLHPARASFLPFINSIVSLLFDRMANLCIGFKMAQFKKLVQACMLKKNLSEAMLGEMGQILLNLELPEPAKEILKEALIIVSAETAMLNQSRHKVVSPKAWAHDLVA